MPIPSDVTDSPARWRAFDEHAGRLWRLFDEWLDTAADGEIDRVEAAWVAFAAEISPHAASALDETAAEWWAQAVARGEIGYATVRSVIEQAAVFLARRG